MDKIPVVLVALDVQKLERALRLLNYDNVLLAAIITENPAGNIGTFTFGNLKVPIFPFSHIQKILDQAKNSAWLINGFVNGVSDIYKVKKFLMASGVPENNIVNFEIIPHITQAWIANIRYIEKYPIDFFATGISYVEAGLNFRVINGGGGYKGINLSSSNQDLRQGYLTAKYVFEHTKPGTIKFVLIGLTPYSLRYDNIKSFAVCPRNLQYVWTLQNSQDNSMHGQLLNKLISNEFKSRFIAVTAENADPNFEKLKAAVNREIPVKAFISWQDELKNLTKDYYPETVEQNLKILEDYIKLCLQNGAKPICFMFPFAPAMYENYDKNFLAAFRWTIHTVTEKYKTPFIDLFDLKLDYDCFYNMAHLNWKGSISASLALSFGMYKNNILPIENFCTMNYETAIYFSQILDSDSYRNFMRKIYKVSVEKIRRKAKIKIAFVLYDSSMWCGDALYNLFAQNERYEVTIFLCLRIDQYKNEKVRSDFIHGVNQLKSHGLNVVAIDSFDTKIPTQDFIIFLTPYNRFLPRAFYFNSLTAETLTAYIPYSYTISSDNVFAEPIQRIIYKHFCDTKFSFNSSIKNPENSVSATYYSGYPKMDVFFDEKVNFKYDWKMAVPNAKKIIWAPHWSIDSGVFFATFQHNYKFMYEYAKAHPEISWVVKPHPNLLYSAVRSGVFKSAEKFKEYLQAWENLPNAKVETGAYYHAIFATSDGMIQDCGSFIYEYQYTHKPMIFLTCDTQRFNSMGNELMKILYRVDGRDLQGIADSIYKIFVEGNDPLFDARLKFFDENLNYKKLNGMTASEFIFKTISKEFE